MYKFCLSDVMSRARCWALLILCGVLVQGPPTSGTPCPAEGPTNSTSCDGRVKCFKGECKRKVVIQGMEMKMISYCQCQKGWAGDQCDVCCPLDCGVGGQCVLADGGAKVCSCDPGYTGDRCVEVVTNSKNESNMTLASPNNPTCAFTSTPCINGHCGQLLQSKNGRTKYTWGCVCDPGWSGPGCDQICDRNCTNGVCDVTVGDMTSVCVCHPMYTGEACDIPKLVPVDPSSTCSSTSRPTHSVTCLASQCVNGECMLSSASGGVTTSCKCDPGWRGDACDHCCDLPCDNGTCSTDSDGMYCICDAGIKSFNRTSCYSDGGSRKELAHVAMVVCVTLMLISWTTSV